jgi:hypothetical protein
LKIFADRGSAEIKELLDKTAHNTGSTPNAEVAIGPLMTPNSDIGPQA